MANLSPRRTGLPFVVWISPKGGATHDVLISVAFRPEVHVVDGGQADGGVQVNTWARSPADVADGLRSISSISDQ
jgi:hypothetical protein